MLKKISLKEKFQLFETYWSPKILGEVNDSYIKIFKAKGNFVWHHHQNEDECFLVIKGELRIKMKDQEIVLQEGELFIIPKGVKHMPYAPEEAYVLLFEPKEVLNTGDQISSQTVDKPKWL